MLIRDLSGLLDRGRGFAVVTRRRSKSCRRPDAATPSRPGSPGLGRRGSDFSSPQRLLKRPASWTSSRVSHPHSVEFTTAARAFRLTGKHCFSVCICRLQFQIRVNGGPPGLPSLGTMAARPRLAPMIRSVCKCRLLLQTCNRVAASGVVRTYIIWRLLLSRGQRERKSHIVDLGGEETAALGTERAHHGP
jgi:hypothetical protein